MRKYSLPSVLIYLFSLLPFWLLYLISDFAYLVLYRVVGYRVQVVRENLQNAFPEKSPEERKVIEKRFYRYLPDLMVETLKMRTMSARQVQRRFQYINPEEVERHMRAGRSVVGVSAHYGNWELAIFGFCLAIEFPVLIIYKPLSNKKFDRVFNKVRTRFGAILIPMKQTLRQIINYRNQPHMSIFLADQSPTAQESNYFMPFLNQQTAVFTGPGKIATRTDSAVVYCHIDRIRRGHYTCVFTTLVENATGMDAIEVTHLHNQFTENIIRNKPELWLWSHKRWKRKQ